MVSNHKKAVVIGEAELCIQCAEFLVNSGWKVLLVVSDDVVIDWVKNSSVPILVSSQLSIIKAGDFYLFSIINPYLIPKSFLANKKVLLVQQINTIK